MPYEPVSQSHLTNVLQVGARVVIRLRLPEAEIPAGGPHHTDVVGEVLSVDAESVVVGTRRGPVTAPLERIVLAKKVPPAPVRKRRRPPVADADSIDIDALQTLMTAGMPPLVSGHVGEWWLRSAEGYTGRANSALPLGDPGMPLKSALEQVTSWYADNGQPALIQLPHAESTEPATTRVGAVLAEQDWRFFMRTLVMTKPTTVPGRVSDGVHVETSNVPMDDWWTAASPRALAHRETLARILGLVPDAAYLTAYVDDRPVGHARLAFHESWSGIFDVHTDPGARRGGVARGMMATAAQVAVDRRIPLQYLQVAADNTAAVGLYESLGWRVHHAYHYATPEG